MRFSIHQLLHGLLVTLLTLHVSATLIQPNKTDVPHVCFGRIYETKTTYETNLHTLMSKLTSQVTASNGFNRITVGQNAEDTVTGYTLCRGDISQSACSECLNLSTTQLLHDCSDRVGAIAWYDNCMLKYSPSSAPDVLGLGYMYDFQSPVIDVSNFGAYFEARYELLSVLAQKTSMGNLTRKFSAGKINFTASDTIYALMQCIPDLNEVDCATCLNYAAEFPRHPAQKWRALTSDCDVRVAPTEFYNTSALEAELYSLPPVARNNVTYSRGNTHRYVLAIIILAICCIALLATICILICLMVSKKKIQSINDRTSTHGVGNAGGDQRRDQLGAAERDERPIMGQNQRTSIESSYAQDETSHTWILNTPVDHPSPR